MNTGNNLISHLTELEKEQLKTPKASRKMEMIKTEINKIEMKQRIQIINETKIWSFEKQNGQTSSQVETKRTVGKNGRKLK